MKKIIVGLLLVAAMAFALVARNETSMQFEAATFRLPLTLLTCISYYPKDGETLASWDFEQPVRLDFRGLKGTVTLHSYGTTTFHGGCQFSEPHSPDGIIFN